ncbi:hypothetical protein KCU90_g2146, partial [Aureobasidium melanogenum]
LSDVDTPRALQKPHDERGNSHALQSRANAIECLHGPYPPGRDEQRRDQPAQRQRKKGDEDHTPVADALDQPVGKARREDHHQLRDHDCLRGEGARVALMRGDNREAIERQHRGITEVKHRERGGQQQQRAARQQHAKAARLFVLLRRSGGKAPCAVVIDGIRPDQQRRDDRQRAEDAREREHRAETIAPAKPARQRRANHVARVIGHLVAPKLPVEAALVDHAERHARHGRPERGACHCREDLRGGDHPVRMCHP